MLKIKLLETFLKIKINNFKLLCYVLFLEEITLEALWRREQLNDWYSIASIHTGNNSMSSLSNVPMLFFFRYTIHQGNDEGRVVKNIYKTALFRFSQVIFYHFRLHFTKHYNIYIIYSNIWNENLAIELIFYSNHKNEDITGKLCWLNIPKVCFLQPRKYGPQHTGFWSTFCNVSPEYTFSRLAQCRRSNEQEVGLVIITLSWSV